MARILVAAKYTFFVSVVLSAGFAIQHLTGIQRLRTADSPVRDLSYNFSSPLAFGNFKPVLDKQYLKCLTEPSKPFCILSADKRLDLFRDEQSGSPSVEAIENRLQNITTRLRPFKRLIYSLLVDFTRLMTTLDVKLVVIEPSMLFCMLSYNQKYSLLMNGFNPSQYQGSRNVVTFGIFHKDSKKINQNNATYEILSAGFRVMKIRKSTKSWSWLESESEDFFETVHYFYIRDKIAVHVVVFYRRESYLWHAGLNAEDTDFEGLLFVNNEAFENFTALDLSLDGTSLSRIFIPHDIRYFSKEMEASRFMECSSGSSTNMTSNKHSTLNPNQLNLRAMIALRELKSILVPEMAQFWLWGSTLTGWYEQCNIWHHSTVLELSLPFKSSRVLNLTDMLANNEFLKVANDSIPDSDFEIHLDCHGLSINIFIIYEEHDAFWYKRTEEQEAYRIAYPASPICSTDIFGLKVNMPCDLDINSEIRQNWSDRSWNESRLNSSTESEY